MSTGSKMAGHPNTQYLSPEEVGKMFRASKWTVRRWVEAGRLPAVRLGRRLLIPGDAVQKLVEAQLSPSDVSETSFQTHRIVRDAAPNWGYFELPFDEAELDTVVDCLFRMLNKGGWPSDTFALKKSGLKKMVLGEERVPPAIWRYLRDGILQLKMGEAANDLETEAED